LALTEESYFADLRARWEGIWPHPALPREPLLPLPPLPVHRYLAEHAKVNPDKMFLQFYGRSISYREMDVLSDRFAAYLSGSGCGKGMRTGLLLPNCPQFYVGYFGTLKAGGVCVLYNPMLKPLELEQLFRQSEPRVVLTLDRLYPLVAQALAGTGTKVLCTSYRDYLPQTPEITVFPGMTDPGPCLPEEGYLSLMEALDRSPADQPEVALDDWATMNFTGGTTGLPKSVLHTHRGILYTASCLYTYNFNHLLVDEHKGGEVDFPAWLRRLHEDEVSLAAMPVFWVAGKDMGVDGPVVAGGGVCLLSRWDPLAAMEAVHKYRVTTMYAPFDLYRQILDHPEVDRFDLGSLRNCTGSSFTRGLTAELRQAWLSLTGTVLREAAYGLTETHTLDTMTAGFHAHDLDIERSALHGGTFCGLPQPGTRIKIVDPQTGDLVPPGTRGEVAIRSPSLVAGYAGDAAETAKSFRGGWFHTGDVGMYDEDGFFYYVTRIKYMLKVSGISVYPAQIEAILLRHPGVALAGVIGVADEARGQVPVAFVTLQPDWRDTLTATALADWCRENMAPHNVPAAIVVRESLPLTATGKVLREALAEDWRRAGGRRWRREDT